MSQHALAETETTVERYLTAADCEALFQRITKLAPAGDTQVAMRSTWSGTTRWIRNAITMSTDRTNHVVTITRIIRGASGSATINQLDDESLALGVATAERQVRRRTENPDSDYTPRPRATPKIDLFKRPTYELLAPGRSAVARTLVEPAVAKGVFAAGYLDMRAEALGAYDTKGMASHAATTSAEYLVTVRDQTGMASGWAGLDDPDWSRIDAASISARAVQKCLASANPVAVEPGRYTVILEPQAAHAFVRMALAKEVLTRPDSERYDSYPYNLRRAPRGGNGTAKFGHQLIDERLSIWTDPMDPEMAYLPFTEDGSPYDKVTWFENGILRELPYGFDYGLEVLGKSTGQPYTGAYRMSGGEASLDEMVASTRRGLLITRFVDMRLLHRRSVLVSGMTADGTWLVENGKISKPIRNMRFNASPLLALNSVEMIGRPQRVHSPGAPAIAPVLKIREFLFTSMSNAI